MQTLLPPLPAAPPRRYGIPSALAGGGIWVIAVALLWPGWGPSFLLLAALAAVPLGLALVDAAGRPATALLGMARGLQLPAALALAGAFALPKGPVAAALAVPWLAVTVLAALLGLLRLRSRGLRPVAEACSGAGLVYLAVGGGWAVLARAGARPLDFSDDIVLATAIHFHYAGFVLPLLTGLAGRALPGATARAAAVGVIAGVPLVAAGITLSALGVRLPEWLAAWFLCAAAALVAGRQLWLASRPGHWPGRLLLAVSGFSLFAGMYFAWCYAATSYQGQPLEFFFGLPLSIPTMQATHGVLNAFGFALPGLLAWNLASFPPRAESGFGPRRWSGRGTEMQIRWTFLNPQPDLGEWEKRPFWPGVAEGPRRGDRRDCSEREVAVESPGEPEADGPYRRLARAVLDYDIFPPHLVTGVLRRRPVEAGDTVGIRYHFFPGIDLFFAARVVRCFDEQTGDAWRTGFTYRTLRGHPVIGEETFSVEKDAASGRVRVALRSWSRPGTLPARALAPLIPLFQAHAARAALDHLGRLGLRREVPAGTPGASAEAGTGKEPCR